MKNELRGFEKIFAFTFRHQAGKKSYRTVTASVAILCILIPSLIMMGLEYFGDDTGSGALTENDVQTEEAAEPVDTSVLKQIFVVDVTHGDKGLGEGNFSAEDFSAVDYGALAQQVGVDLSGVKFIECGRDFDRAAKESAGSDDSLILAVNLQGSEYILNLLIPEDSGMNEDVAYGVSPVFDTYVQAQAMQLNGPQNLEEAGEDEISEKEALKEGLGMLLLYINIMLIYFFVLLYGQGVSQSVVLEKSSKLMDVFLITVRPSAMILGKMTAICLTGVLQLFLWIASLAAGFGLGYVGVKAINPDSDMLAVQLLSEFGRMTSGMFSIGGFLMALLIILGGMLLYCALGGIGGALAGKQDDLSSTNLLFTLILIASFFACLYGGGIGGEDPQQWLYFVPFTSIMVAPSAVLLGSISMIKASGVLLIILLTALFFTVAAGRIYKNMALYKGDLPGVKQIVKMIK